LDLLRVKLAGLQRPALRARIDEPGAVKFFEGGGPMKVIGPLLRGSLRKVAFVQVPYRVFEIAGGNGKSALLAFDVFTGTLDPYTLDASTEFEESSATQRNHLPVRLDEHQALASAQERYQRIRFQEGFFKNAGTSARIGDAAADVYVPYWIAFFGSEPRVSLRVLNAVRRVEEGSRLRQAVTSWIAERTQAD
jgi:hypothetical protein